MALLSGILALAALAAPPPTLRLDYVHSGSASEERFALGGLALEGPWPGRPGREIDDTNLGGYRCEVRAPGGRVLYSRGFASVFAEWRTTEEAGRTQRAFRESLRFPQPEGRVTVAIQGRGPDQAFRDLWSVEVDPQDPAIDRAPPPAGVSVWSVIRNGEPADKVDLLLVGDGYTAAERDKWHADARRIAALLFAVSPFKERRADFNVWALDVASDESGIARPSDGVARRSAIRAGYDAFGSERYVLAFDDTRLRESAAAAPYEFVEIVANDRKYGGGGIFGQYATAAADNAFTGYLLVHEFAHHFAGLADEYYTSAVAYAAASGRPEPWEPNVSADARSPKWRDLLQPGVPLPTPWAKAEFEAAQREIQARRRTLRAERRPEAEMEALFREERALTAELLGRGPHAHAIGAFEGAMYEATGYYRAQADCIMFTRSESFCAACRRAIERVIDLYTRPAP